MVKFKPSMRSLSIISEGRKSSKSPPRSISKELKKKRTQINFNVKDFRETEELKSKLIMHSMRTSNMEKIHDEDDFKISEEKYLQIIFALFSKKDGRSLIENQLLLNYLKTMTGFVEMLVKGFNDESMVSELLTTISFYLSYSVIERNSVLFRYGDKGEKFYIILKGSVDILIAKERKVRTSEFEYMTYLATLKKYYETEIYHRCLQINQQTFNVEFEEDFLNKPKVEEKENKFLSLIGLGSNKSAAGARKSVQARRVSIAIISELSQKILAIPKLEMKKETTEIIKNSLLHPEVFNITSVTTDEYIKRLKVYNEYKDEEMFVNFAHDPRNSSEASKFKLITVVVYEYHQIASLTTGQTFGELALENPNNKRTATIVTKEDTHFGLLNKETYTQCIKEVNEKYKKQNLNFIFNNQLFSNANKHTFLMRYYNYFVNIKFNRGKKLLLENEQIDTLYFIKDGEYDVTMNKSLHELTEIIKIWDKDYQKDQLFGKSELNRCNHDPDFKKFYYQKKSIRISIIKGRDIIGFEDFLSEGKSLFTVECTSTKGEAFQLETKFFNHLYYMQNVKENTEEFRKMKKSYLLEKLIKIREAKVSSLIGMLGRGEATENPNEIETNISQIYSMKHMSNNMIGHLGNLKDFKEFSTINSGTLVNSYNHKENSKNAQNFPEILTNNKREIFTRNKKFKLNLSTLKENRTKNFLEYDQENEDCGNNKEEMDSTQSPDFVKKNLTPNTGNNSISRIINKFSPLKLKLSNISEKQLQKIEENRILFNCKTSRNDGVSEKKQNII
jgi:CRP-like cAMP-binding protein